MLGQLLEKNILQWCIWTVSTKQGRNRKWIIFDILSFTSLETHTLHIHTSQGWPLPPSLDTPHGPRRTENLSDYWVCLGPGPLGCASTWGQHFTWAVSRSKHQTRSSYCVWIFFQFTVFFVFWKKKSFKNYLINTCRIPYNPTCRTTLLPTIVNYRCIILILRLASISQHQEFFFNIHQCFTD